jgi:hypothetical protein
MPVVDEIASRFVAPFYLKVLHGNVVGERYASRRLQVQAEMAAVAGEVTFDVALELWPRGWREGLMASWWAAVWRWSRVLIPWFEDLRAEVPEDFPFPLYPEPGGLLPWAKTGDGTDLCWLTEGQPDSWPTAAWNIPGGGHRYDMIAAELLYRYLSGQLHVELLRPAPAEPWFDPYRERWEVSVALAPSDVPYKVRLRILREHLAPTADRGSHEDALGRRRDQFKAIERDWLLTFHETGYAADWIEVAFPPEDNRDARAVILAAVRAMGSRMLSATRNAQPVWSDGEGDV